MFKVGDLNPDGSGRVLLGYQYRKNNYGTKIKKEWWVTKEQYEIKKERVRLKNLNWRSNNREHYRKYVNARNAKNPEKNRKRSREWALKNPDKVKAAIKRAYLRNPEAFKRRSERYKETHREQHLAYRKRWRKEKGDIELARTRKWRADNPEKAKESRRKTYYGNPDVRARMKAYAARRKSLLKDAFLKLSGEEQKKILRIYKMAELISEHTGVVHHVDHWHPLAKGGQHHPDNLVIVKAEENLKKKAILTDDLPAEFFSYILLPTGFFQMDWIWRGGRKPRAKKEVNPPPTLS
jgi:phage-related minor tail protein